MTNIRSELIDTLYEGTEALENAGQEVENYQARMNSDAAEAGTRVTGETPEEAIDNLMNGLDPEDNFFVQISGDEAYDLLQGEEDPEALVYRNITGTVEIDGSTEPVEATGTTIQYTPGEDTWEVSAYDLEDGQERVEDVTATLEEYGLEAEVGEVLG